MKKEHHINIMPNLPGGYPAPGAKPIDLGNSVYKFKVVCSCQWEVLVKTEVEAEQWARSHCFQHGYPSPLVFRPGNKLSNAEQV